MKNRIELRDYIRFQLGQLGTRNGEHEFEQLAFELARQRHIPNLVPATGPVKAGGDQGRDFESYKSYLAGTSIGSKAGVIRLKEQLVVGACTLNKKTPTKIRTDLKVIFAGEAKPETVYYFCEPNVPVATRHKLQDECKTAYNADLVIFDGLAIADQLADAATFWIAQHFLSVPSEFFPEETDDGGYTERRAKWLAGTAVPLTLAEFLDVKYGLRATIDEDYAKADLAGWTALMRSVVEIHPIHRIRQSARYEIIVAQFRGRQDLDPVDSDVDDYFKAVLEEPLGPNEALNAATLASFCHVAVGNRWTTRMTRRRVAEFAKLVDSEIDRLRTQSLKGADLCLLLEAVAGLSVIVRDKEPASTRIEPMLRAWLDVLDAAENVPHYPIWPIATLVEQLAPMFADRPTFQTLRDRVDEFMRTRAGNRAVAERSAKRAQALLDAGNRLGAIDEMHRARVGAFTGEEVPWSVYLLLMLSRSYQDLGLHIAARYYAAGAYYITGNSADEDVFRLWPQASFALADCFYTAGEGMGFLHRLYPALAAHFQLVPDPGKLEDHPDLQRALVQASLFSAISKRLIPDLESMIVSEAATWPIDSEDWNDLIDLAESSTSPLSKMSIEEVEGVFQRDLGRAPYVDLGPEREYRWKALGVDWTVASTVKANALPVVLGLIAVFQLMQAELAGTDLLIIPAAARLQISVEPGVDFSIEADGSNEAFLWKLILPTPSEEASGFVETTSQALAIVSTVIGQMTAMDEATFQAKILAVLERGFSARVFAVRSAADLFAFLEPEEDWEQKLVALSAYRPKSVLSPLEPADLAWKSGPAPTYSKEKAYEMLRNRYRRTPSKMQYTLPRIVADARLHSELQKRRDAGVLDWQMLVILMNIVVRMQAGTTVGRAGIDAQMARVRRDELPTDPIINLDEITSDVLDTELKLLNVYVSQSWGLRMNVGTPVFEGIKRLLDERYGNATDDIEHENLLGLNPPTPPIPAT